MLGTRNVLENEILVQVVPDASGISWRSRGAFLADHQCGRYATNMFKRNFQKVIIHDKPYRKVKKHFLNTKSNYLIVLLWFTHFTVLVHWVRGYANKPNQHDARRMAAALDPRTPTKSSGKQYPMW